MGKAWDYDVPRSDLWKLVVASMKPGAHLLSFFGSRTYHRGVVQIEDAGLDIRDQLMWIYGSGFPKSLDVSKAIDKAAGADREVTGYTTNARPNRVGKSTKLSGQQTIGGEITSPATSEARQWQGFGTALKPAHEPIVMARKPFKGTVAANVLSTGCGALNIDGCRIGNAGGRFPANILHDGSEEVLAGFPDRKSGGTVTGKEASRPLGGVFGGGMDRQPVASRNDTGSAARFFYCSKASRKDRDSGCETLPAKARQTMGDSIGRQPDQALANNQNHHPTVKPTDLMRYLCRLVTPPTGIILDPFMGSGSTGKAALLEGFRFVGIERDPEYFEIACKRIAAAQGL